MKFVIATHNANKVKEFMRILKPLGIDAVSQTDANIDIEVEETGTTFAENSLLKAQAVSKAGNCVAIADDSGLCIDAFDGGPGVYSSRFLGEKTPYTEKNSIILEKLKNIKEDERGAHYVCSICCVFPNGDIITAEEIFEGKIGYAAAGSNGFGYDPIFYIGDKSAAELSPEEKDKISHRGKALRSFVIKLKEYLDKDETNA